MIRSCQNYKDVIVVVDIKDYDSIIEKLKTDTMTLEDRKNYHIKLSQLQEDMMR